MAYFSNAFTKVFMGNAGSAGVLDEGFIDSTAIKTVDFYGNYGPGAYGLVGPSDYTTKNAGSADILAGKPMILAGSALYQHDKVGPFHGGYQETNKSKLINPKYISRFYRVDPCLPNQNIIHIGATAYTNALSPATAGCCHDFKCDSTYYLRLDVKGSPVLRYLTRNAYWTADFHTGCCTDPTSPNTTDPTLVMIGWATGLLGQGELGASNFVPNVIVGPFIWVTVTDFHGVVWYQPGTTEQPDGTPVVEATWWSNYVSDWDPATDTCADGDAAGLTIMGAYVDTVFGDCTFYPSDFFQKEPVHIYASEVDQLGDPCVFTGICVVEQCAPRQGQGYGDTVLKDLILSESYQQNYFNTNMDLRIREITQGYDISSAVTRSAQYYRYFILHSVPRFNNPSGVFDNDQYLLQIIVDGPSTAFEATMDAWLTACGCNAELETIACGDTCP